MASRASLICLALGIAFFMMCNEAKAQSSCTNTLMGLAPCLSYVTGNSSTPSPVCCSQLGAVVQSAPVCLCAFMSSTGAPVGLNINQTLALALPQACNIQTPPASQCNANGPASPPPAEPSPAPAAASPESPTADAANTNPESPAPDTETPATTTPATPSASAGGASKTVPAGITPPSDGSVAKPALLLVLVAVASMAANF